jgi:hypothetical protein
MWFSRPDKQQTAFDDAPYLFPYFFDLKKIRLTWRDEKLTAETMNDPKLKMWSYCYFEANGETIGVINFWTNLFSTEHLRPIKNLQESIKQMKEKNLPFLFDGDSSQIVVSINVKPGLNDFIFPEEYKEIDELAFFSTKDELYLDQLPGIYWANYVLVILRPQKNEMEIIPLDWFYKSGDHFGYVWPARIARSKIDNRFYAQGIRMANFILDPTGKQRIGGEE